MNEGYALHLVDYLFLGFVLIGTIRGLIRGLSKELMVLLSLGIIVWASGRWYGDVSSALQRGGQLSAGACDLVAYGLLVFALFLVFLVLRLLLRPLVKLAFNKPLERIGGAVIGGLEAALTAAAALIALSLIPDEGLHDVITKDSRIGARLTEAFPKVYDRVAERFSLPEIDALKPGEKDAEGGASTHKAAKSPAAKPEKEDREEGPRALEAGDRDARESGRGGAGAEAP